ncbi:hypothetical protein [Lysinibacillus capsici]|uniref:hypothetical protein n=1 Tax=Lysinibacillus capsici TaxID=2115968 RepID=UPI00289BAB9F|nr:hypothetical protein [Lysinibacillus capsici]
MEQRKTRTLASFTSMFEEIKENYNIDILKYDSFESFVMDFFLLLNNDEMNVLSLRRGLL